jgi:hypothetical protein
MVRIHFIFFYHQSRRAARENRIAQKLHQTGHGLNFRSIERAIAGYGLQKNTLRP